MGVYIKGMDMPKNCLECDYTGCQHVNSVNYNPDTKEYLSGDKRHPNCPLAEVPTPHGELIDKSEVLDAVVNGMIMVGYHWLAVDCIEKNASTVIEAETGE